jgi:hypothetical protein
MARMAHFHDILKKDLFKRITFLRTFVSTKDVLAAAGVVGVLDVSPFDGVAA